MSQRETETNRERRETDRRAAVRTQPSGGFARPQDAARISGGTVVAGAWVPYGRLGITALSAGFRLRGE